MDRKIWLFQLSADSSGWRNVPRHWIVLLVLIFLAGLALLAGCQNETSDSAATIDLDSLPVNIPDSIFTIDAVDTTLFGYLIRFGSLDDGSVLIAAFVHSQLFQLNPDGTGRVVAGNGHGPADVQSVNFLSTDPEGNLYLFDRATMKLTQFNRDLVYKKDFVIENPGENITLSEFHATAEPGLFLVAGTDREYIREQTSDPKQIIGLYHWEEGSYSDWIHIPYTRVKYTVIDDIIRAIRGVPFTPTAHVAMHPEGRSFYMYFPPSEEIVELSLSMDTLKTMPVVLPEESFISSERDSVLDRIDFINVTERREMDSMIPEVKPTVDHFIVDDLGRFWLRLTRRSPSREWLVLGSQGDPQKIVQHPNELEVTHISSKNIGFYGEDIVTFTLFEPVD